jgi:hypothetical protein
LIALALVLLGGAGLAVAWPLGLAGGVLAAGCLGAVAAGALLAAAGAGQVAVRATGGALFVAGSAVLVTQHQVWWWMPAGWAGPVSAAAAVLAAAGLGVLLFAYGIRLAALSGALGLLAVACLGLTLPPYIGSDDEAVLRAWATALGAVALTAGARATTARPPTTRPPTTRPPTARVLVGRWWLPGVAVAAAAAAAFAGYDSWSPYATGARHAAVLVAAVAGVAGSLALGVPRGRAAGRIPPAPVSPAPVSPAPAPPAPAPAPAPSAPAPAAPGPAPAPDVPGRTRGDRLQTASAVVGLVIGVITIAKELAAMLRAMLG